jgi:hypothetical protein
MDYTLYLPFSIHLNASMYAEHTTPISIFIVWELTKMIERFYIIFVVLCTALTQLLFSLVIHVSLVLLNSSFSSRYPRSLLNCL